MLVFFLGLPHAVAMRLIRHALCGLLAATASAWASPGEQGGRALLLDQVTRAATARGVPPALADAVAMIETGYRPDATGAAGEVGLMQVLPSTAATLGFRGTLAELYEPATNIRFGVEYLARAWALSGGDVCKALTKYRAGLGETVTSPLSAGYCARGLAWLAGTRSALGKGARLAGGFMAPLAPDPYVMVMAPALAAPAHAASFVVGPPSAQGYGRRQSYAARNAALQARFDSHLRQGGPPLRHGEASARVFRVLQAVSED